MKNVKIMNAKEAKLKSDSTILELDAMAAEKIIENISKSIHNACGKGNTEVNVDDLSINNTRNKMVIAYLKELGYVIKHYPGTDDGPNMSSVGGTTISWKNS